MIDMTGRDLIIHILSNGLENEPVFKNGKLLGFLTESEAAVKFGVGRATIQLWIERGQLDAVKLGNLWYIPQNVTNPLERINDEKSDSNTGDRTAGKFYDYDAARSIARSGRCADIIRRVGNTTY